MQRDLVELERDGLIEVVNPGGKPQRYRQMSATLPEDEADWQYVLSHIRDLVHDLLPQRRLDRVHAGYWADPSQVTTWARRFRRLQFARVTARDRHGLAHLQQR